MSDEFSTLRDLLAAVNLGAAGYNSSGGSTSHQDTSLFVGDKTPKQQREIRESLANDIRTHGWILFMPMEDDALMAMKAQIDTWTNDPQMRPGAPGSYDQMFIPQEYVDCAREAYRFCSACASFLENLPLVPRNPSPTEYTRYFANFIRYVDGSGDFTRDSTTPDDSTARWGFGNPFTNSAPVFHKTADGEVTLHVDILPVMVSGPWFTQLSTKDWMDKPQNVLKTAAPIDPLRGFVYDVFSALGWAMNQCLEERMSFKDRVSVQGVITASASTPFSVLKFGETGDLLKKDTKNGKELEKSADIQSHIMQHIANLAGVPVTFIRDSQGKTTQKRMDLIKNICLLRGLYLHATLLWGRKTPGLNLRRDKKFDRLMDMLEWYVPDELRNLEVMYHTKKANSKHTLDTGDIIPAGESPIKTTYLYNASAPVVLMVGLSSVSQFIERAVQHIPNFNLASSVLFGDQFMTTEKTSNQRISSVSVPGPRHRLSGFGEGKILAEFTYHNTQGQLMVPVEDSNPVDVFKSLRSHEKTNLMTAAALNLSNPRKGGKLHIAVPAGTWLTKTEGTTKMNLSERRVHAIQPPLMDSWAALLDICVTTPPPKDNEDSNPPVDAFRVKTTCLLPFLHLLEEDFVKKARSSGSRLPGLDLCANLNTIWSREPLAQCFRVYMQDSRADMSIYVPLENANPKTPIGLNNYVPDQTMEPFEKPDASISLTSTNYKTALHDFAVLYDFLRSQSAFDGPGLDPTMEEFAKAPQDATALEKALFVLNLRAEQSLADFVSESTADPSKGMEVRWIANEVLAEISAKSPKLDLGQDNNLLAVNRALLAENRDKILQAVTTPTMSVVRPFNAQDRFTGDERLRDRIQLHRGYVDDHKNPRGREQNKAPDPPTFQRFLQVETAPVYWLVDQAIGNRQASLQPDVDGRSPFPRRSSDDLGLQDEEMRSDSDEQGLGDSLDRETNADLLGQLDVELNSESSERDFGTPPPPVDENNGVSAEERSTSKSLDDEEDTDVPLETNRRVKPRRDLPQPKSPSKSPSKSPPKSPGRNSQPKAKASLRDLLQSPSLSPFESHEVASTPNNNGAQDIFDLDSTAPEQSFDLTTHEGDSFPFSTPNRRYAPPSPYAGYPQAQTPGYTTTQSPMSLGFESGSDEPLDPYQNQ
jgi:hypothetical protein